MLERQKKSIESPGRMVGEKGRDPEEEFVCANSLTSVN